MQATSDAVSVLERVQHDAAAAVLQARADYAELVRGMHAGQKGAEVDAELVRLVGVLGLSPGAVRADLAALSKLDRLTREHAEAVEVERDGPSLADVDKEAAELEATIDRARTRQVELIGIRERAGELRHRQTTLTSRQLTARRSAPRIFGTAADWTTKENQAS